jgi:protein TonB
MTRGKSIIGIVAVLAALSSCSEVTECAMETKPAPPAVTKVKEKIWICGIEQMPSFPGGQKALLEYLAANVRYPDDCEEACVQGRVVVSFVVERDGSITEPKVVKSVYPSLDEEALRVVNGMPKWSPGKLNGEAVRIKYVIPVTFKVE